MDQHYSAFISYKHAPTDMAVAAEIQKRLERYHVPAAIRKKTGKDKIGRIFRDEEELPITSDLGEKISKALEEADYLIVICSPSTKESTWVPREINYFLKNHSKKQVLTVLADGEPMDVIPEQLLKDTITHISNDGQTYEEEVIYEPLSCDYRQGIKESRKTEIPRLAATLLGCAYDELVMRERQYKRHRNLAIGIPAVFMLAVAIIYLIWSRQEIEKNYQLAQENLNQSQINYRLAQENLNQSLINQATYLSTASSRLLENGDRIRAILLALEALPTEEGDQRPLTAQAQKALVEAVGAYQAPGNRTYSNSYKTVAEFKVDGFIEDYYATDSGKYVVIRDSNGTVTLWDAISYEKILTLDDKEILDVQALSDTEFVARTNTGVVAYEIPSGKEVWCYEDDSVSWYVSKMKVSVNPDRVWLAASKNEKDRTGKTESLLTLLSLDVFTGEVLNTYDTVGGWSLYPNASLMTVSADSKEVAVAAIGGFASEKEPMRIFLWNTEKNMVREILSGREYRTVQSMGFIGESKLVVMAYPLDDSENGGYIGYAESYQALSSKEIELFCCETELGNILWKNSYFSAQISHMKHGNNLGFLPDKHLLVSVYANKAVFVRMEDGMIDEVAECSSAIVGMYENTTGVIILLLNDGKTATYHLKDNGEVIELSYFDYPMIEMSRFQPFESSLPNYLVVLDNHRIWLSAPVEDNEFVRYKAEPMPEDTSTKAECICRDTVGVMDFACHMFLYDMTDQTPVRIIELDGESYELDFIGADESSGKIWVYNHGIPNYFLCIDVESGSVQKFSPEARVIYYPSLTENGELVYFNNTNSQTNLLTAQVEEGVLKESLVLTKQYELGYLNKHYFIRSDNKLAVLHFNDTGTIRVIELEPGVVTEYSQVLKKNLKQVVWGEKDNFADRLAVTDGYEACILTANGSVIRRLSETGAQIVSMGSYEDELVILYSKGMLTRYSWSNGTLTGRTNLQFYNLESFDGFDEHVEWIFQDQKLIMVCHDNDLLHIIDLVTWKEEAWCQDALVYDATRNRIVCSSIDRNTKKVYLGYFPHYTLEDLLRKAKEALHGAELTEEELAAYGLE